MISIIAAIDEQRGLGKDNTLLCHLPADLQHFKRLTMGKTIVMGRRTFESIGKALPGRKNIVLTHQRIDQENIITVPSLAEALLHHQLDNELMIIGGASVYAQALTLANRLYITVIHHTFDADVYFPAWNKSEWNCTSEEHYPHDTRNKYDMTFYQYDYQPK